MQETLVIGLVVVALVGAFASLIATVRQTRKSQQAKATRPSPMTSSEKERVVLEIETAAKELRDVVKERMPLLRRGDLSRTDEERLSREIEAAVMSAAATITGGLEKLDAHKEASA